MSEPTEEKNNTAENQNNTDKGNPSTRNDTQTTVKSENQRSGRQYRNRRYYRSGNNRRKSYSKQTDIQHTRNAHDTTDDAQTWRDSAKTHKKSIWQKIFGIKPKKLIPTVIDRDVHHIDKSAININALKVVKRLQDKGYDAYIVGGAVRDLLSQRIPKDFDVVTNATPHAVKKIFGNARIIGRRFKLVHIIFKDCIIETATFRATADKEADISPMQRNNIYGTIEDDCMRRDFSINALYYDPQKDVIVDYVGGYRDMMQHKLKVLREPNESFQDDPVRMIRAVKYSNLVGCVMDRKTIKAIMTNHALLSGCPVARLHEEINKIFKSHKSAQIFRQCYETHILSELVPFLTDDKMASISEKLLPMLDRLDQYMQTSKDVPVEIYWAVLVSNSEGSELNEKSTPAEWEVYKTNSHDMLAPLKVPNRIIDRANDIVRLYTLMYGNANLPILQKIRRMQLTHEILAFAMAADCKPMQDILQEQIKGLPQTNPNKKNKRRRRPRKKPDHIKTVSLDEIPEETHTPSGKKCISTHKSKE